MLCLYLTFLFPSNGGFLCKTFLRNNILYFKIWWCYTIRNIDKTSTKLSLLSISITLWLFIFLNIVTQKPNDRLKDLTYSTTFSSSLSSFQRCTLYNILYLIYARVRPSQWIPFFLHMYYKNIRFSLW